MEPGKLIEFALTRNGSTVAVALTKIQAFHEDADPTNTMVYLDCGIIFTVRGGYDDVLAAYAEALGAPAAPPHPEQL